MINHKNVYHYVLVRKGEQIVNEVKTPCNKYVFLYEEVDESFIKNNKDIIICLRCKKITKEKFDKKEFRLAIIKEGSGY